MPNWREIVEREGPAVWRTVYRIVGNRADADECFQEAFLAAWEVSRREQVQNWRAFLLRLAAARAVDRLRQRHRRNTREQTADWEALPGREPTPSQTAEETELSEQLRLALARLAPRQAEIFCLHCLEGWSYQEIAEHLVISVDSVGVLLHRARRHLRQLLDSHSVARRAADCEPGPAARPEIVREECP
jgi:RNA polymerase sigma-70 factor, ECF subfamily